MLACLSVSRSEPGGSVWRGWWASGWLGEAPRAKLPGVVGYVGSTCCPPIWTLEGLVERQQHAFSDTRRHPVLAAGHPESPRRPRCLWSHLTRGQVTSARLQASCTTAANKDVNTATGAWLGSCVYFVCYGPSKRLRLKGGPSDRRGWKQPAQPGMLEPRATVESLSKAAAATALLSVTVGYAVHAYCSFRCTPLACYRPRQQAQPLVGLSIPNSHLNRPGARVSAAHHCKVLRVVQLHSASNTPTDQTNRQ